MQIILDDLSSVKRASASLKRKINRYDRRMAEEKELSDRKDAFYQDKAKRLMEKYMKEGTLDLAGLERELGKLIENKEEERYEFTWPGKRKAMREPDRPSKGRLVPCREESVDFDNTENLYIEGDNLEVLKILKKSYKGKVKMIYIDPPYNTGHDFVYKDNFHMSDKEWKEYIKDKYTIKDNNDR